MVQRKWTICMTGRKENLHKTSVIHKILLLLMSKRSQMEQACCIQQLKKVKAPLAPLLIGMSIPHLG
jgi:hypothetical protein